MALNKFKEIHIKNRTYFNWNGLIAINDLVLRNIVVGKKLYNYILIILDI